MSPTTVSGVNLDRVARWLDDQHLASGELSDVSVLGGGTQNVMLRFRRGAHRYVLRRAPLQPRESSNEVLRREMRVLRALSSTTVAVPHIVAACPGTAVLGDSVFYVMEEVDGVNCAAEVPGPYATEAFRHRVGPAAARAAATLGELDLYQIGLTDFGRPEGYLERQVSRWLRELESYSDLEGYPGPDLPQVTAIADWLERNRPCAGRPGLLHGDFHLANLLFAPDRPEVAAIVDWELATVGDPLLDLGWLLATWPVPGEDGVMSASAIAQSGALATRDELVKAYAEVSSRDLGHVLWYQVLACFKLGILLEGTYARACAGKAPLATGELLHRHAIALFSQARKEI